MAHGNLGAKTGWTAWVLAGCGAKGAFQAGAIGVLDASEPSPDFISGCSAGALNATGYCYLGPVGLKDYWFSIRSRSDILATRWNPLGYMTSIYDPSPLKKMLDETMSEKRQRDYWVVYSDLKKLAPVYVKNPRAEDVLASASIPGAFPPVDGYKVDGGVFDCAPLKVAIDAAPPEGGTITVVLGDSPWKQDQHEFISENIVETMARSLDGMCQAVLLDDLRECNKQTNSGGKKPIKLRIICPDTKVKVGTLDFTPEAMRWLYRLGKETCASFLKKS